MAARLCSWADRLHEQAELREEIHGLDEKLERDGFTERLDPDVLEPGGPELPLERIPVIKREVSLEEELPELGGLPGRPCATIADLVEDAERPVQVVLGQAACVRNDDPDHSARLQDPEGFAEKLPPVLRAQVLEKVAGVEKVCTPVRPEEPASRVHLPVDEPILDRELLERNDVHVDPAV